MTFMKEADVRVKTTTEEGYLTTKEEERRGKKKNKGRIVWHKHLQDHTAHNRKQFTEKLGFEPYPGTLNLKLNTDYDLKTRSELDAFPAVEVQGFQNEGRTFGTVKCYPAIIENKIKGALILALRGHYDNSVLEVIAPVHLRKRLNLKDGNKVKVEILTLP